MDAYPSRFRTKKNANEILNLVRHDHNYVLEENMHKNGESSLQDVDQCVENNVCEIEGEEIVSIESDGQRKDLNNCNLRENNKSMEEGDKQDENKSRQNHTHEESTVSNDIATQGLKVCCSTYIYY